MPSKPERSWVSYTGVLVAGFVAAYLAATLGTARSLALGRLSALLQFLGVVSVVLSLRRARKERDLGPLIKEVAGEFSVFFGKLLAGKAAHRAMAPDVTTRTLTVGASVVTTNAEGTVSASNEASVEKRLEAIEKRVANLAASDQEQFFILAEAEKATREFATSFIAATEARPATRIEIIGLIWLSAGVLLPGFPHIAILLWPLP